MTFGLTPAGFKPKRLADVKQDMENGMIAEFGDVNLDPQAVFGQLIGVLSKTAADVWENDQDVYLSQYPNSAEGVSLDNVVQLNGITRLPAQQTNVTGVCQGLEATTIPINALARIPDSGEVFFAPNGGFISRSRADMVKVQCDSLTTSAYTILLNNAGFTYSLPTITFSANFVTGNQITVTINGTQLATVPFTTDNATTLALIASTIQAFSPPVSTAATSGSNIINITPTAAYNAQVTLITITGGASQPSYTVTFRAPASINDLMTKWAAIINFGTPAWLAVVNGDNTLTITTTDSDVPFSATIGSNLAIIDRSSPVTFLSQNFGPISAPVGTLTEILTPVSGWASVNNTKAGVTGRFTETDSALRIRRQNSLRLLGASTVEAIRARILQEVPGVTSCFIFENREIIQEEIDVVFNAPLVTGNTIVVTINGRNLPGVAFVTSNLATMTILAQLLAQQPEIDTAVVGGTGNNTIAMNMNIFQQVEMTGLFFAVSGGASQAVAVYKGGRYAKSFECVVEGGTDNDVANKIWNTKPAGIQTFGNINNGNGIPIVDSMGNTQVIFFSRPTPIYIWVTVALTLYSEETFPTNGVDSVALSILNYGNSLGIGIDVLLQRVLAQIFNVPGIASGAMQIAATNLTTDNPSYGSADISIAENEVSVWDVSRIVVTIA